MNVTDNLQMKKLGRLICVLAVSAACTTANPKPGWLRDFITKLEKEPLSEPATITKYQYKGATVYFYPSRCCDIPSKVFDASGAVICYPDGDFSGRGDGKCPDFMK